MVKALCFDVCNTLLDAGSVEREMLQAYAKQIEPWRHEHAEPLAWHPLDLPAGLAEMEPYPDSAEAMQRLRSCGLICVTLSNWPLGLQTKSLKRAGIVVDAIVPLELCRAYKPDRGFLAPYRLAIDVLGFEPHEIGMVTANRTFGDLESAAELSMKPFLIRDPLAEFSDLAALADKFQGDPSYGAI